VLTEMFLVKCYLRLSTAFVMPLAGYNFHATSKQVNKSNGFPTVGRNVCWTRPVLSPGESV